MLITERAQPVVVGHAGHMQGPDSLRPIWPLSFGTDRSGSCHALSCGAGWGAGVVQHPAVGTARGDRAVGVQGELPAPAVHGDQVMEAAQQDQIHMTVNMYL